MTKIKFTSAAVVGLLKPRCDGDRVGHADHTTEFANGVLRRLLLIVPIHLTREGDPSLLHPNANSVSWNTDVPSEDS